MSTGNRLTDAAPRVENLAQMLQFQDKAVVSRMLVKNAGGSVTLFPARVITASEASGQEMDYNAAVGPFAANPAGTTANRIGFDIILPRGLYYANDSGGLDNRTVTFRLEYQQIDADGVAIGSWVVAQDVTITARTTTPIRRSYRYAVTAARYQCRVTRTSTKDTSTRVGNDIAWGSLRAYLPGAQSYGDVTLLAMRIRATDNISAQASRKINCIVTRKLPIWSGSAWSLASDWLGIVLFCPGYNSPNLAHGMLFDTIPEALKTATDEELGVLRLRTLVRLRWLAWRLGLRRLVEFTGQMPHENMADFYKKADIFVSLHADAAENRSAWGSSVYVLSLRGASSQHARWLADKENASDLVGGVRLTRDTLSNVLLDLAQSGHMKASQDAAGHVLTSLKGLGKTHKPQIEFANFEVLRNSDMPAMLVETGFISNPDEEKRLFDPAHQRKVASAVLDGIQSYFTRQPPPGTLFAARAQAEAEARTVAAGGAAGAP